MSYSPYGLGATLYMPATRDDITDVILGQKIADLKSMVICLEDSVAEQNVSSALENLIHITEELANKKDKKNKPMVFIRPRNIIMAQHIVENLDISGIDGIVISKFTLESLPAWEQLLKGTSLIVMPTLETKEVFNSIEMQKLATALQISELNQKIIALRIGGNDLMSILGMRRIKTHTIYDSPLGYVIKMLVCTFGSVGYKLTAPVFELIGNNQLLKQELEQDLSHGLIGKTAIHPTQLSIIHQSFMVNETEYQDANKMLNTELAVYQHNGAMCEPATHSQWAKNIIERSIHFGIKDNNIEMITKLTSTH